MPTDAGGDGGILRRPTLLFSTPAGCLHPDVSPVSPNHPPLIQPSPHLVRPSPRSDSRRGRSMVTRAAWCVVGFAAAVASLSTAAAAPAEPGASASSSGGSQEALRPPIVRSQVPAVYPPAALSTGRSASVELLVTVLADGRVGPVEVARSEGDEFDAAAMEAVRRWTFVPARRGDEAIASKIRVPFLFAPPAQPVPAPTDTPAQVPAALEGGEGTTPSSATPGETPDRADPTGASTTADGSATGDEAAPLEVVVQGERALRDDLRGAGDVEVTRDILAAAPRQEGAEVLRTAPGVYIGRAEGPAVAHNYNLRGFDAEHGQDIEFRVAGLPINLPSHIHGQGYADLSFLLADVVQTLRVREGVYDPRQGDFAVAGSIDVDLGVAAADRGVAVRSSYGAFNTFRQSARWAPREIGGREMGEETFGAVQVMRTDGYGENRSGHSASALLQHRFGEGRTTYRAVALLHTARGDLAGVVRRDDVDDGTVCFTCVYPYATARAQVALSQRFMSGLFADFKGENGSNGQFGLWVGLDTFRIQQNFTGFIEASRTLERTAGRGDLIEQQNKTTSVGLTGRYRTAPFRPAPWFRSTLELGTDGRIDLIGQRQNLLDASVRNQTWDERIDADIRGVDVGMWLDVATRMTRYVDARVGVRADVLSYEIDDRLGNFAPLSRPDDSFLPGFRRSALGIVAGPRTSLEVHALPWMSVLAAYGEGYRSPQARVLEDGERAPYTKVRSADGGLKFDWGAPLSLNASAYYTRLSDDVAFDAGEGRLERTGATRRLGATVHAVSRPTKWLVASASMTYVKATLLEPPPATADEPLPPFTAGQDLPFVPPLVVRVDLGARHQFLRDAGGQPLSGRLGVGYSLLSKRPLPFDERSPAVSLLDASAGLTWGPIDLAFEVFNVLDTAYAAMEYSFASDWDPEDGVRPRTPARHISAGAPFSWMLSLEVKL